MGEQASAQRGPIDEVAPVLVVTGGSRGIGSAVARRFAAAGFKVCVVRQATQPPAGEIEERLRKAGSPDAVALSLDVMEETSATETFDVVMRRWGRVDVLVNAAGIMDKIPIDAVAQRDFSLMFGVNAFGTFYFCRAAGEDMAQRSRGRMVNISSISSQYSLPDRAVYEASKAAVDRLTYALARAYAPRGIQVNAVAPGLTHTDQTAGMSQEMWNSRLSDIPAGRAADPAEIADLIFYLGTEAPDYLVGAVIPIDGGRTL